MPRGRPPLRIGAHGKITRAYREVLPVQAEDGRSVRARGGFSSATNVVTFSPAKSGISNTSKIVVRQQISETCEFAKCVVFQRGTSRKVFTTDVSVNEVQAFIGD